MKKNQNIDFTGAKEWEKTFISKTKKMNESKNYIKMEKTEQEKLVLSKEDWDKLVKKLSSIVSKAALMESNNPHQTVQKAKQIKIKALECLDIINKNNK